MRRRAKKVEIDGITFDSLTEGRVYTEQLRPLARAKKITQLQVHPKFTFIVNDVIVGSYKPDFVFCDQDGKLRCWDAKGFKRSPKTGKMLPIVDRGFGKTKKLMKACFGIDVECV